MSNLEKTKSINDESLSKYLMSRYHNREDHDSSRRLGKLVSELRSGGYSTIGELHKDLERTKKAVERFEAENPRSQLVGNRYSAIEIVIISISLLHKDSFISWPNLLDNCSPEKLEEYRKLILPEPDKS